jgi:ERCC4-type nuclease
MAASTVKIVLDSREHALRQHMPDVDMSMLDAGDAQVLDAAGEIQVVVERKKAADLAASIRDGRWHEQRQRAVAALKGSNTRLAYVVEGMPAWNDALTCVGSMDAASLRTALVRAQFDGCGLYETKDAEETAAVIRKIASVVADHGATPREPAPYTSCVSVKKTDNVRDPKSVATLALATVHGVTASTAEAILDAFGVCKLSDLLKAREEMGSESWREKIACITRGKRKLGPVLASALDRSL